MISGGYKGRGIESYIVISLRRQDVAAVEPVLQVELLSHVRNIAHDLGAEHRASQAATVREEANAFGLAGVEGNVGKQGSQTGVDGGRIHVTAQSSDIQTRAHPVSKGLLGQTHEGLLHVLVGQRLLVVHIPQLRSNLSEGREGGVGQVVIVEHTAVGLLHQLASGGVEADVVETVQRRFGLVVGAVGAILDALEGLLASMEGLVAGIDSLRVALEREVAIDDGVLAGQVRLEEVVGVGEVGATETRLEDNGGVRTNEQGHTASTTSGTSSTLGVQSNISADYDGVTAIPGGGLDPVDAVENSVGATVAGVEIIHPLDVGVAMRSKQLHQHRLDRLGLIQDGLGTDLETANGHGVDIVLAEER